MSELLTLVQATRDDVAQTRQRVDQIAEQVATLSARDVAARTELERHRADDRRELDDHEKRIRSLHSWSKRMAGGLAVLVLLVTVGAPVALWTVGG